MTKLGVFLQTMAAEPPFRLIARVLVKYCATSVRTKARWDAVARPYYLLGLIRAADQARDEGVEEFVAIEFGVASGQGLLALQDYASAVEDETGVRIKVFGFDSGAGLPLFRGDYRDHPDTWISGDYPMDEPALRAKLSSRTSLIIGNVADTVSDFVEKTQPAPLGFVVFDLDLYSSTRDALKIFTHPKKSMLRRVVMYFDDIDETSSHCFAGELLAIEEFNVAQGSVCIDKWRGVKRWRPFPEKHWLEKMYVAHDLEAISQAKLHRGRRYE